MYATLGLLQAVGIGFAAIALVIIAIFVGSVILSAIKIVKEYERGVIFRLGRVQGGAKGPGLFILLPFVDKMVKIDLRTVTMEVPPQEIITEQTEPWGIKVSVVEVKDVEIPQNMQRAMARQAESERERRAKIIAAEGEYQASERLRQAADRLESPTALQLRLFQTMGEIAVNQNSTIILPVPVDLLRPYLSDSSPEGYGASAHKSEEERRREERKAERRYQQTIGEVSREVSSEEVHGEMPEGAANP